MRAPTLALPRPRLAPANARAARCADTTHDTFTYEGTKNDDLAKFTAVLEKGLGGWTVCHAHRATGQPPPSVV